MNALTSPLVKVLIAMLLAALVALGATGWLLKRQIGATATVVSEKQQLEQALRTAQEARERDSRALARLRSKNAATARSDASTRQRLDDAKREEPEWADTPLPPAVKDALNDEPEAPRDPARRSDDGVLRRRDTPNLDSEAAGVPPDGLP